MPPLSGAQRAREPCAAASLEGSAARAGTSRVNVAMDARMGMIGWRGDGREMYFLQPDPLNADVHVMAVDVTTAPTFEAGTPRLLFKLQGPVPGNPLQWKSASSDGERFVFTVNVPSPAH